MSAAMVRRVRCLNVGVCVCVLVCLLCLHMWLFLFCVNHIAHGLYLYSALMWAWMGLACNAEPRE